MGTYKAVDTAMLDAGLTTVADALRAGSGSTEPLSFPDGMAAEADAVHAAGQKSVFGKMDSINCFFQGNHNQALFDTFCDSDLSGVHSAQYVFQENTWLTEAAFPDSFAPGSVQGMFADCKTVRQVSGLDHAGAETFTDLFNGCTALEDAGCINLSLATAADRAFQDCTALKNITFIGPIGLSVDIHWSPLLSGASISSMISALSDTATGLSAAFSLAAVNAAFETAEDAADGAASEEWLALAATKANWTISLL